jgi:diguanylate cyclase (GGDEF)-like protein
MTPFRLTACATLLLAATLCNCAAHPARAACLELSPADVRALQSLGSRDPRHAIQAAQARLETAERDAHPDESRMAGLYAVEAQAYSLLELDEEARAAALKGLELAPIANDSTRLSLQMAYAENVYDSNSIDAALSALEKARGLQLPGSRAALCLQITIGRIQNRRGRSDLAILNLTEAYRAGAAHAIPEVRIVAASALSPVMRIVGDFKQALALNQEAIDWELAHNATLTLSLLYYLQGQISAEMHDYPAALEQTEHARRRSVELGDRQGIGFDDLATCRVRLELTQLAAARADCENARLIFTSSHSVDAEKEAQILLARLDLVAGHAESALGRLNEALSGDGAQLQPRRVPGAYELRAHANAELRKYPDAYRDLSEYLQRYTAGIEAERAQQVASIRTRFETDRALERNNLLQRELALADEQARRQKTRLRWVIAGSSASVLVIALLTYLLVINRRYRRQLIQLASEDSLTGLPNRGCITGIATEALARAGATREPLCIALIDLDRFKAINDCFGHATGDRVLREFANMVASSIRPADALGRWGGEEFLLVLPNTTLDIAVGIVDLLRLQAGQMLSPQEHPQLHVSFSAGLAMSGRDPSSLDELVAQADVALYEAKDSGRDLVRYRTPQPGASSASSVIAARRIG